MSGDRDAPTGASVGGRFDAASRDVPPSMRGRRGVTSTPDSPVREGQHCPGCSCPDRFVTGTNTSGRVVDDFTPAHTEGLLRRLAAQIAALRISRVDPNAVVAVMSVGPDGRMLVDHTINAREEDSVHFIGNPRQYTRHLPIGGTADAITQQNDGTYRLDIRHAIHGHPITQGEPREY